MKKSLIILVQASALVFCATSHAGTIAISPITNLASTGISPANNYTHTISGGSAAVVNGVNFALLDAGNTPANFIWSTGANSKDQIACCNNGTWNPAAGGVTDAAFITLMGSFTYSGNGDAAPAAQTYSLLGLMIGTQYQTRFYVRSWDSGGSGRPINVTFSHGAESNSTGAAPEDRPSLVLGAGNDHQAYYLSYSFTAMASQLNITAAVLGGVGSGSAHMYALTNQVVPEPSSMVLLALGAFGFIRRRRRR